MYNSVQQFRNRAVSIVLIEEIGPVLRDPGIPIFNKSDDEGIAAEARVLRILRGFVAGDEIPPIAVSKQPGGAYRYELSHGVHRLYCSLAAGFTHVPATDGY